MNPYVSPFPQQDTGMITPPKNGKLSVRSPMKDLPKGFAVAALVMAIGKIQSYEVARSLAPADYKAKAVEAIEETRRAFEKAGSTLAANGGNNRPAGLGIRLTISTDGSYVSRLDCFTTIYKPVLASCLRSSLGWEGRCAAQSEAS